MKKSFILAASAAATQYYDYHLYGFLAAAMAQHFFSHNNIVSSESLMKTYFGFFLGVVAKPLGAVILGGIGDRHGRGETLKISLLCTASASIIIAFIPAYAKIGILASILLILCRMVISTFVSLGTDGIRLYVYENIGQGRECLGNGLVIASMQIGSFLASIAAWFFTLKFFPKDGWKFAFILGAACGYSIFLIKKYKKDYSFQEREISKDSIAFNMTMLEVIKSHLGLFILGILAAGAIGACYQFNIVFLGTFNSELLKTIPKQSMKLYTSISVVIYMCFSVIAGSIADNYGRRRVANLGYVSLLLSTMINLFYMQKIQFSIYWYFISVASMPFLILPSLTLLQQSIPMNIRYRIFSFSHAIGSITISATAAFLATYIYHLTSSPILPMIYFALIITMLMVIVNFLSKKNSALS